MEYMVIGNQWMVDESLEVTTGVGCYLDATSDSSASLYKHNGYRSLNFFTIPSSDVKIECMEKMSKHFKIV